MDRLSNWHKTWRALGTVIDVTFARLDYIVWYRVREGVSNHPWVRQYRDIITETKKQYDKL